MGTYRQPSLVLDKSYGQINEAMKEFNKNLIAKINADKKEALANEKAKNKLLREQEKANARYRDYGRDIEKKLSVLKPFFEDDEIAIKYFEDALDSNLEDETGGASFELKSEVRTLYTALADYREGTDEYEKIKDGIEARLAQAPVLFNLLNTTSTNVSKGYNWDGKMKEPKAGINNIILRDLRAEMSKNISQKTNQGRFHYNFDEKTMMSSISYVGKNGDVYEVPYDVLENNIKLGTNGLLDLTDDKPFKEMLETAFDPFFENEYKNLIKQEKITTSTLQGNVREKDVEKITNVEEANLALWDRVSNWVDGPPSGLASGELPWYAQNNWQLLGGKTVFDPTNQDQLEEAKQMLYDKLLRERGQETTFEKDYSKTDLKDGYGAYVSNKLTKGIKLSENANEYITQKKKDLDL